ncbi:Dtd1 [Symbiodinium natans]|uniref:D-aminoacyl-tRNA deacylase n=1 Tax=Symbiodinium natans TaxID=878477 RepID=A0A812MCY1_9DINO|nr:Dtd1 [Symbiodinium natans]
MKLLGLKVSRAAVQVNGLVVTRIGVGLVLFVGFRAGDAGDELKTLAAKVTKIKLWPDVSPAGADADSHADPEPKPSNVVDCGYEVLVVLQQSLCAIFPGPQPTQREAMDESEAQLLFQELLKQLRLRYQEEMVVAAPFGEAAHVETTSDGLGLFDLSVLNEPPGKAAKPVGPAGGQARGPARVPSVETVTKALRKLSHLPRGKLETASSQIYRVMGMKKFRDALSEVDQAVADDFAEALEAAGKCFPERQQEQITAWTGLAMSPGSEAGMDAEDGPETQEEATPADDLDQQLEELREEVANPEMAAARKVAASKAAVRPPAGRVKSEAYAPAMAAARSWVRNRQQQQHWQKTHRPREPPYPPGGKGGKGQKGKKGKGKSWGSGRRAIGGILSLDASANLHGTRQLQHQDFESGQLRRFADGPGGRGLLRPKVEITEAKAGLPRRRPAGSDPAPSRKLAKGTPTLEVMTPPPTADDFNDI